MGIARVILLLVVVIGFCGCKSAPRDKEAAAIMREANTVLAQSTRVTGQWTSEYGRAFTPQNRAKFPTNREELQTAADNIIKTLDEHTKISNDAIAKYEEAIALMSNEQQRKGATLLVSALKKSLHVTDMIKSQMHLVSDQTIVDEKSFNEKFTQILQQINDVERETQAEFKEARRLLGM